VSTPASALTRNLVLALVTLVSSAGTLVCCVLPAILVALGAGAALAGLVSALPQLVWLSEHKPLVFGLALVLLVASAIATWYARALPCPTDPVAARACQRLRRLNVTLYGISLVCFSLGLTFALISP
jgi:hypothetical protein